MSSRWSEGFNRLRAVLATPRLRRLALFSGFAYALLYLFALGHLVIAPGTVPFPGEGLLTVTSPDNLWRERAPYNFEPIAVFHPVEGFAIFLAVPNLLLAAALGLLMGLNVSLSLHAYSTIKACGVKGSVSGLASSLPALLTGFACCAPTFLILIGATFAAGFLALLPLFMPVAFAALLLGLAWNLLRAVPAPHGVTA